MYTEQTPVSQQQVLYPPFYTLDTALCSRYSDVCTVNSL